MKSTLVLVALLLTACSITRNVRPLGEGNDSFGLSVGGPLLNQGYPLPMPQVLAYVRHGVTDQTDVDFGLTLPVTSVVGIDGGASYALMPQEGLQPAVTVGGRLYLFGNGLGLLQRKNPDGETYSIDPRVYQEIYSVFSWNLSETWIGWTGVEGFFQVERGVARPVILLGAQWQATPGFSFGVEIKYLNFFRDLEFSPINVYGLGGRGAFGLQLGFTWMLGEKV